MCEVRRPRRETGRASPNARASAGECRCRDATREMRGSSSRAGIRRRVAEGVEASRERDRDFDALLFADRESRTDTVGGCVSSGPAKGLCGGNWMNPDPTTREGFCGASREGIDGERRPRSAKAGVRERTGASIGARR